MAASRLSTHTDKYGLAEHLQSAYKDYHSTEIALIKVQNDRLLELDKRQGVI